MRLLLQVWWFNLKKQIMKRLALVCLLIFFTACKNESEKPHKIKETSTTKESLVTNEINDVLIFNINAVVAEDDEFIVYYLDVNDKEISNNRSISQRVKGSNVQQTLSFTFPKGIIPVRIIIKTGNNEINKVDIIDAKFTLNDTNFDIPGSRFFDYFIPNDYIAYNNEKSSYEHKKVEGEFNPYFLSRKVLIDRLEMFFY